MGSSPGWGGDGGGSVQSGSRADNPPPLAGEEFGPSAARLAGQCCILFGWSPDRFWRATPAEVAGVVGALAPTDGAALNAAALARLREALGDG